MKKIDSLQDIIKLNSNFRTAVNLYLSLNKPDKVLGYIPTKSSVAFLGDYVKAVIEDKEQATLFVGPYGKGKSHLLLVLLAILSMERNDENSEVISHLVEKIKNVDDVGTEIADRIQYVWNKKGRFLPVLITDTTGDLNQAFLYGLNDALKREKLNDLCPDTYYALAIDRIKEWEKDYKSTYETFENELVKIGYSISRLKADLKMYSKEALEIFKDIYPTVTAGSKFNPLAISDVLPLFKSTSEKLTEEYGYSGIYIVFDEFSKFIEGQNGAAVGTNMKLLQDICELAADSQNTQIFFTLVAHKSIKEYGKYLSQDIINSFTGIEGRIIEKYFITSSKNNYELIKNAIIKDDKLLANIPHFKKLLGEETAKEFYQLPAFKSKFLESEFVSIIMKGCYPLNPISAYLLLNISEKVAQNERTLFTFISNDEPHSMARFIMEHKGDMEWSIGVDLIYDYFRPLFKKEVANEFVHNVWLSAEYAIERCNSDDQIKIIKALAIILIANKEDEIPASEQYLRMSVSAIDGAQAISELVENQFIYKKNSTGCYTFKTKAGSELRTAIKRQRELKGDNVNYAQVLSNVTGKYHVIPRRYNTLNTMTRFFSNQFMEVEDFLNIKSAKALMDDCNADGKVITLFNFASINQDKVKTHVLDLAEPRLIIVCPKKSLKLKKQLKDYEIIQELRTNQSFTSNNEILKKELPLLVEDLSTELEMNISNLYEEESSTKIYFFNNGKISEEAVGNEEYVVNKVCECLYTKTPVINNELVNRMVIGTAQTKKSRANIIQAILDHSIDEGFFQGSNQEATIYRSLFCVTKVETGCPEENLADILNQLNLFVDSCSDKKVSMRQIIDKLISAPYGMRLGLIPFYFAKILATRREDIVVYFSDKEIQLNADIIVYMCENPDDYEVYVSKEDLQKEKYIGELNLLFQVADNRNLSANRIKDILICMQRWFRALPQVSRNTIGLEKYVGSEKIAHAMKALKRALQKVEFNPFEILFVELPTAFETATLAEAFAILDECKTFYDDYFDWIQAEAVSVIYDIWGGKRKNDLFHTIKEWYENQSKKSKHGLYNGRMTNFMSTIEALDVYSDAEIAKKIVKASTDVYMENWNVGSIEDFKSELASLKQEIESIRDEVSSGEMTLVFTKRNGEPFEKTYTHADEGTGSVLKNIIEDTLDEYDDLSINDRVSILLEMIEKITG